MLELRSFLELKYSLSTADIFLPLPIRPDQFLCLQQLDYDWRLLSTIITTAVIYLKIV